MFRIVLENADIAVSIGKENGSNGKRENCADENRSGGNIFDYTHKAAVGAAAKVAQSLTRSVKHLRTQNQTYCYKEQGVVLCRQRKKTRKNKDIYSGDSMYPHVSLVFYAKPYSVKSVFKALEKIHIIFCWCLA